MNSSSEMNFQYQEMDVVRSAGPLERLWQSSTGSDTAFLSGSEVRRRELEAHALGLHEAENLLRTQHERELSALRCEIADALAEFDRERQRYFQQMEKEVVRLAVAIARKVVGRELQAQPALLQQLVRQVLLRLERDGEACLRVPAKDLSAWEAALAASAKRLHLSLLSDEELAPGRCILETALGTTDLDPFTELEDIEAAFLRVADSHQGGESPTVQ